jgi:chromosome segregation ATPase
MSESKLPVENAKAFMQNAFSLLSSTANPSASATPTAKAAEKSPDDIPKEELVHLCMKMNKRMQNMELKGQELIRKKNSLLTDRKILLDFLKSIPLHIQFSDDQEIQLEVLLEGWKQYTSTQHETISSLESKLAALELTLSQNESRHRQEITHMQTLLNQSTSSTTSDPNVEPNVGDDRFSRLIEDNKQAEATIVDLKSKIRKYELEIESRKAAEITLKGSLSSIEVNLVSKTQKLDELQKMLEVSKTQYEERVLFLQLQLNNTKTKEDSLMKDLAEMRKHIDSLQSHISSLQMKVEERDIALQSSKEINQALQNNLIETEALLSSAREYLKDKEMTAKSSVDSVKERDDLIASLRKEVSAYQEHLEGSLNRIKDLEEYRIKTEGLMMKLASQTDQINQMTISLEDSASLITRLRSEAQANDRNHAMRTAMLATCEAQLDALKQELGLKTSSLQESVERVTSLQSRLASTELRFEERLKEANTKVQDLETKVKDEKKQFDEKLAEIKAHYEANIEESKKEFAKKSNLARSLITEKEEENRLLSAKVQELQTEISSGAPSERKILELAQTQARRENFFGQHR